MLHTLSLSSILVFMFMAGNRFSTRSEVLIETFKILKTGTLPETTNKRPKVYIVINYRGLEKQLIFNSSFTDKVRKAKDATLEMKTGLFGYKIIENIKFQPAINDTLQIEKENFPFLKYSIIGGLNDTTKFHRFKKNTIELIPTKNMEIFSSSSVINLSTNNPNHKLTKLDPDNYILEITDKQSDKVYISSKLYDPENRVSFQSNIQDTLFMAIDVWKITE